MAAPVPLLFNKQNVDCMFEELANHVNTAAGKLQ